MRRIVIPLAVICMLFSFVNSASAKSTIPHTRKLPYTVCSSGCTGDTLWNGFVYGATITVYVPNYTGSSTNVLNRFIQVKENDNGGAGELFAVGYCFGNINALCNNNAGTYWTNFQYGGVNHYTHYTLPNADKNNTIELGIESNIVNVPPFPQYWEPVISFEQSGAGGYVCGDADAGQFTDCEVNIVADGQYGTFWDNYDLINSTSGGFTGTRQGKFDWTVNAYQTHDYASAETYQSTDPQVTDTIGAQMTILVHPAGSSNKGGTMEGCNESTFTCV